VSVVFKRSAREIIYFFIGFFYFIFSILLSPFNLINLLKVMLGEKNKYYAFSEIDAGFRTWYNKIAYDFKAFNRAGYSWDDGIGLSLASRAYNNQATYFLTEKIGQLRLAIYGRILWVSSVVALLVSTDQYEMKVVLVTSVLLFFSPLISQIYTLLGKPEVFWWFFVPPLAYFCFSDTPIVAAIIWSILAFVNAPSAFLVALTIMFSSFLFQAVSEQYNLFDMAYFVLLCLPGVIKLVLRLRFMIKTKYLSIIGNEQKGLWKRGWLDFSQEWLSYSILAASLYFSILSAGFPVWYFVLFFGPVAALYYLNWRLIYLNDVQSFFILFLSYAIGVAIVFQSNEGLLISCLYFFKVFLIPKSTYVMLCVRERNIEEVVSLFFGVFSLSSLLKTSDYREEPLIRAFDDIPENSRIVILTEARLRSSKFRKQIETLRFNLLEKRITQVNDCYGTMQSNDIAQFTTEKFIKDATKEQLDEMEDLLKLLQVGYLVTFDEDCAETLIKNGMFSLSGENAYFEGTSQFSHYDLKIIVLKCNFYCLDFVICGSDIKFIAPSSGEFILPFSFYSYLNIRHEGDSKARKMEEYIVEGKDLVLCKTELREGLIYIISCEKALM
jgi:hypothetical protein